MCKNSLVVLMILAASGLSLAACDAEDQGRDPPGGLAPPAEGLAEPAASADWLGLQSVKSPGQWLADHEPGAPSVSGEPGGAAALTVLLEEAGRRFVETPRMIANRTVQLRTMLAAHGVHENAKTIIEGFIGVAPTGSRRGFGEMCQHYYNLRLGGQSREEALIALGKAHDRRNPGER